MYYLFIEIQYYSQLKRIASETIQDISNALQKATKDSNAKQLSQAHPFLYEFNPEDNGVHLQAAQAAFRCFTILEAYAEKLHGFKILLDSISDSNASEASQAIRLKAIEIENPNKLFIGKDAIFDFSDYFTMKDGLAFREVEDFILAKAVSLDEDQRFWHSETMCEKIRKELKILEDTNKGKILFSLQQKSGGRENLQKALEKNLGCEVPVLLIKPYAFIKNPYLPILKAFAKLENAHQSRPLREKHKNFLYESLLETISFFESNPFKTDFSQSEVKSIYELFVFMLEKFKNYCNEKLIPCIIVIENVDLLFEETFKIVQAIFEDLTSDTGSLLILFSESEKIGIQKPEEWKKANLTTIDVDEWNTYLASINKEKLDIEQFNTSCNILTAYHSALLTKTGKACDTQEHATIKFLKSLAHDLVEIFFLVSFAEPFCNDEEIREFLESSGRKKEAQNIAFNQLYQAGLIRSRENLEPVFNLDLKTLETILGDKFSAVKKTCSDFLYSELKSKKLMLSVSMLEFIAKFSAIDNLFIFMNALHNEFSLNSKHTLEFLKHEERIKKAFPLLESVSSKIAFFTNAQLETLQNNALSSYKKINAFLSDKHKEFPLISASMEAALALSAFSLKENTEALNLSKTALLQFQKEKAQWGESLCNRILGMTALSQGRLFDAMDYFSNSGEIAEKANDLWEKLISLYYEGITFFIHGNLSRALHITERMKSCALRLNRRDWLAYINFFQGRISFETGRYVEAQKYFCDVQCEYENTELNEASLRTRVWIARCHSYLEEYESARRLLHFCLSKNSTDIEAIIFLAETELLDTKPNEALNQLGKIKDISINQDNIQASEKISYDTGFSMLEGRAFWGSNAEDSLILLKDALLAYAYSMTGKDKEAQSILYSITRERNLSEFDPAIVMYHFLQYVVIPAHIEEKQVDRSTVLSKAFKHLQLRSSRIDTAEMKNAYLFGSLWNKKLIAAAKVHKLM